MKTQIKRIEKGQYGNEYRADGMFIYPSRIGYSTLKDISLRFSSLIFGESEMLSSYIIKVRPACLEGLELVYTEYGVEDGEKFYAKQYSILIAPDWRISQIFEFWHGVGGNYRRCQNLLVLDDSINTELVEKFETELAEVLETFDDNYFEDIDRNSPLKYMPKDEDGFIMIYCSDPRILN